VVGSRGLGVVVTHPVHVVGYKTGRNFGNECILTIKDPNQIAQLEELRAPKTQNSTTMLL